MPLVAAPGVFVQRLPGSQGLPPIVQPLGHEVSSLATPGLVVLHARPIETAPAGAMPAAVQRSARGRSRSAATPAVSFASAPEVGDDDAAAPAAAAVPMAGSASSMAQASSPARTLPTVSRLTIRMPDRPLTSAAIAARPAALQRSSAAAGAGNGTQPLPPATGMRRAAPAAAAPVVSRTAAGPAPETPPATATPASPSRAGIGAPLDSLPATARPLGAPPARTFVPVVSRSAALPALPAPTPARRAAIQRDATRTSSNHAGHDHAGDVPVGAGTGTGAATAPQLPVLPVSRPGDSRPAAAAPSLPVVSRTAAPESRPTLGARPLQPTVRVQRIAEDDDFEDDAAPDALPSPWWAPEPARGSTAFAGGGPDAAADAPTVSRSAAAGWDAPATAVHRPTLIPRASAGASAARPVQRLAALPDLPRSRPAVALSAGTTTSALVTSDSGQSLPGLGGGASSGGGASLQRIVAAPAAAAATAAPVPQPVLQREAAPASPAPSPVAQPESTTSQRPSERELEDLAQALFSRIRGRLRSELIHDREAKGLTFDNV